MPVSEGVSDHDGLLKPLHFGAFVAIRLVVHSWLVARAGLHDYVVGPDYLSERSGSRETVRLSRVDESTVAVWKVVRPHLCRRAIISRLKQTDCGEALPFPREICVAHRRRITGRLDLPHEAEGRIGSHKDLYPRC